MTQFALPLAAGLGQDRKTIIVSDCNRQVFDQFRNWRSWPFSTAILVGSPRSGKSLLGDYFATNHGNFIDDAESCDATDLFHQWNTAQETSRPLLLASREPLSQWKLSLPDLRSRLAASHVLELSEPDEVMRSSLFEAHLLHRGLSVPEHVVQYALSRLSRSYTALEMLAYHLDHLTLEKKRPATYSLVREALEKIEKTEVE